MSDTLNVQNHDRDVVGMTYVYPVVSRRAGGVSVGINLNPNNACNWHCAYCQVPDLKRGVAPEIDLSLLRSELRTMLEEVLHGDFMQSRVPDGCRQLCDIAISGNGEPTSCCDFETVVNVIIGEMQRANLADDVKLRLISNGSYVHRPHVQAGLKRMAEHHGEVWIKVDSATEAGIRRLNGITTDASHLRRQVEMAANLCPTWIQTCMVVWDGEAPDESEITAYLAFLQGLQRDHVPIEGVLLYGLARPSLQSEAIHIAPLSIVWMEALTERIRQTGLTAKLSM